MYVFMGALPLSDFYPRPPRGGRLMLIYPAGKYLLISIHALREEGDQTLNVGDTQLFIFLSTPSARRATVSLGD